MTRGRDVAFFTGPASDTWAPEDAEARGLGGSETGVVRVAASLADRGYRVTVFGDVREGTHAGVSYRRWQSFDPDVPRLATVSVRVPWVLDEAPASDAVVFWATDVDYGDELSADRAEIADAVVAVSEWHRRHLVDRYPFLGSKVSVARNGVEPSYFAPVPGERGPTALYSSTPDRGLDVLLELWPQIRRRVADARLSYCYPTWYDARARGIESLAAHLRAVRALADQPGVEFLGSLGQRRLAEVMSESRVWTAPSWSSPSGAPFLETSCIGALEAQAAGCWVVASAVGALPETVKVGRLIGGQPNSSAWREEWVDAIVEGLLDTSVLRRAQVEGPAAVHEQTWDKTAATFAELFDRTAKPTSLRPRRPVHSARCPIWCISASGSDGGRERMGGRLSAHDLLDRTRFVDAVPSGSPAVDERLRGLGPAASDAGVRAEAARLASHLAALRAFVESDDGPDEGAIVCEEDVLLHNDWTRRLPEILANLPADASLCALSYALSTWNGVAWAGRHPERQNVCTFFGPTISTPAMYWISRRYAETVLERWDIPFRHLPPRLSADLILQWSGGFLAYPPLAVEAADDTWGRENYGAFDGDEERSGLLGLALIARDEADSLPSLLATCADAFDHVVLVDTGSRDATVERFLEWSATQPSTRCTLEHFEWVDDFAAARQYADDLLTTEWKVWADCDDEIVGAARLRELAEEADGATAGFRFGYDYARDEHGTCTCYLLRERMVRAGRGRWVGRVHEVNQVDGALVNVDPGVALWVHHRERKRSAPSTPRPDIAVLEGELERNPDDARTVFYLAQSHRDAGDRDRAAELYERRAGMGGWSEEVFYSLLEAGRLRADGGDQRAGMALLARVCDEAPSRGEALYELAWRYRAQGHYRSAYLVSKRGVDLPMPADGLFLQPWVYRWGLLFECSISAFWVGEYVEAEAMCERLLGVPDLPEPHRTQTVANLAMVRQAGVCWSDPPRRVSAE